MNIKKINHIRTIEKAFGDMPYCVRHFTKLLIDLIDGKRTTPDTFACASMLRQRIGCDNDTVRAVESSLKRLDENTVWSERILYNSAFGVREYPGLYWIKSGRSKCRPYGVDQVYEEI